MAHLLINGCRQRRAVQQALESLKIAVSCDLMPRKAEVPPAGQRLWTTAVPAAAATAGPESGGDAPPPRRRFKYNHDDIFGDAERLFEIALDAEHEGGAPPEGAIPPELIDEFKAMIEALDRKRARMPVTRSAETLDSWRAWHDPALQPFLAFLARHGAPLDRTVASLFAAGERGRRLMLGREEPPSDAAEEHVQGEEDAAAPYERAFAAWDAALAREGVPLSGEDMLRRWPAMLVRSPAEVAITMAVLRAAVPDAGAVAAAAPALLAVPPLALQGRLVQLHLATEGELPGMLAAAPRLLSHPLPALLANLRAVRALSRSAREFKSFLITDPEALCGRLGKLRTGAAAAARTLGAVLPRGVDPAAVVAAKPQLALVRGSWLAQRWGALCDAAEGVEEWRRQLESLVAAAAAGRGHPATPQAGDAAPAAPAAPEWINAATDPKALGLAIDEGGDASGDGDADDGDVPEAELRSRRAYSALGEALLMKPWRVQRLAYLVEAEGVDGAGAVSLVGAVTVPLDRFVETYPDFEEWRQAKEAEAQEARRQRRAQRWEEEEEEEEEEEGPGEEEGADGGAPPP